MINNFQQSENKGRKLWREFCIGRGTNSFTSDEFDIADAIFTKNTGEQYVIEIKVRNWKYLNLPTHILELSKLLSLQERMIKEKCKAVWYVDFFGMDDLIIYTDIAFREAPVTDMQCKVTTAEDNGYRMKQVLLLDRNLGFRFKRIGNKWVRQN